MDSATLIPARRAPVFAIACWALGLMAFCQLLVAGMALAIRFKEAQQVRVVTREVPKYVTIEVPAPAAILPAPDPVVSRPPTPAHADPAASPIGTAMPAPTPIATPAIADPLTERLVKEGRQARVAGDMVRAILKLEEALTQSPDDPNVQYELGLVHEQMGVFDVAGTHYQRVLEGGISGSGSLYALAAKKVGEGLGQTEAMLGKMSLGHVRIFKDPDKSDGQRVILDIPVQKAPGEEIDMSEVAVAVSFFNRTVKGEIVQLEDKSWVTERWVSMPFDWAGGEESLRMVYAIPLQDDQDEHLFGSRTYYGQVVSLSYKGEVLDVQAWPRDLAAKIPAQPAAGSASDDVPEFQDTLPPDFEGVLPPLPK